MLAVVFSLLSAASLANGAVTGRAGMQGVHPISVIGIINVVGFAGVAVLQLIFNPASLFQVPQAALPWIVAVGIAQFGIGRTSAYIG